ncbi:MAG: polyribonucleotide nucleotidyltransferase [Patescibacteria group bacterium]|nr:polyribonucleotide nucleotidyltransferase [Patescibacteria group bacterium]
MNTIKKEIEVGGKKLSLETGVFAPLANMAVTVRYGDTVVLVTAVSKKQTAPETVEFFPLRVDYQEKLYAGGLIKSSRFVKREGRPSDEATIVARLIDHAIRPLFPKDFADEVQVIATALSIDHVSDAEVSAMIGASAALYASDIPWNGPMATARVSIEKENGENFILNPTNEQLDNSSLNLIISTLENDKVLAMEAGANIIPEEKILKAIEFANNENKKVIALIKDFAKEVGNKKYEYVSVKLPKKLVDAVKKDFNEKIEKFVETPSDKKESAELMATILNEMHKKYQEKYSSAYITKAFEELEKAAVRKLVLEKGKRSDGRDLDEIRPITIELGILPRTHGSAFFRRGLTQSLSITTLGSASLEQLIQNMYGEETKRYMHHYYGLPYSLGEIKPIFSPGRREIGHGALAEKALIPVIPSKELFPYTIRVVSEILSQNGSSSMAATCGSTLSLMDAGVPIKAPVAGVAIGLITDEKQEKFVLLTDMAGVEDFNGFMDFKMAGTRTGVTAIQMDIKLSGIPLKLFAELFERSQTARVKILDLIDQAIQKPRDEVSKYAPRIEQVKINPDQIGLVIGSGGKTIREIMAKSKATVDVVENADGSAFVSIAGVDIESVKKAKELVEGIIREVKVGDVFDGVIKRVADFGAIVEVLPNKEGLMHVSEISHEYVDDPNKLFKVGDTVKVKVINVERDGKMSLSKKALEETSKNYERKRPAPKPTSGFGGRSYFQGPRRDLNKRPSFRR